MFASTSAPAVQQPTTTIGFSWHSFQTRIDFSVFFLFVFCTSTFCVNVLLLLLLSMSCLWPTGIGGGVFNSVRFAFNSIWQEVLNRFGSQLDINESRTRQFCRHVCNLSTSVGEQREKKTHTDIKLNKWWSREKWLKSSRSNSSSTVSTFNIINGHKHTAFDYNRADFSRFSHGFPFLLLRLCGLLLLPRWKSNVNE